MTLERKMKQAALNTTLSYLLNNKKKSSERTARNIIEFCLTLSKSSLSEEKKMDLFAELKKKIDNNDNASIYPWLLDNFNI